MKKIFYLCVSFLFVGLSVSAKIWRVNNNTGVVADFNNVAAAITAASAGDTIHIEASSLAYPGFNITKRLVIIGTGYFFTDATPNPKTQANNNAASINSGIEFMPGSAGSVIEGLTIPGIFLDDATITIQRNNISSYIYLGSRASSVCNADTIRQNYVYGFVSQTPSSTVSNLMLYNNIVYGTGFDFSSNINNTSGFVINNVFLQGQFSCVNMTFQNNIMVNSNFSTFLSSNVFFNNITNNTGIPTGNGNQQNVVMDNVFNGYSSGTGFSSDGRFKLKAGSPAIGAGSINSVTVDCGAFGGPAPYALSGMPAIPSIYAFSAPSSVPTGTTTINITVSSTTVH
jgi:hypothetical protein